MERVISFEIAKNFVVFLTEKGPPKILNLLTETVRQLSSESEGKTSGPVLKIFGHTICFLQNQVTI